MATGGGTGGTRTYIKITGPPVHTQDADGIWTSVVSYSDGSSLTIISGLNEPVDYTIVQIANTDLATNKNQAALQSVGLIPTQTSGTGPT